MTESASSNFSPPEHPVRGYLLIAAAALCWAISATLGRAVFTGRLVGGAHTPINPLIIAQTRTTISFLVLAPILLLRQGRAAFSMRGKEAGRALLLGIFGIAASNYFYYLAIQKTTVATAIILQYTAPIWVLLYMVARRLQRATLRRVASVGLAVTGSALAIGLLGRAQFKVNSLGVVAAQIAAVAFAFYNVAGARLVERYHRWTVLLYALCGAAAAWVLINPPWRVVAAHYSADQWLFLCVFAFTSVLAPFSLYFWALQYLDPTRAIVTSALEPVFSILIAAAALGETLGPLQVLGIVLVLLASLVVQLPERTPSPAPIAVEPIE